MTGNQRGGGTNGHILLDIDGQHYSTNLHMPWKTSATNSTPFQSGQHDVFVFDGKSNHNLPDLGQLHSLTLSLSGGGRSRWFVERIDFHDLGELCIVYSFPCGFWLSRDSPSATLSTGAVTSKETKLTTAAVIGEQLQAASNNALAIVPAMPTSVSSPEFKAFAAGFDMLAHEGRASCELAPRQARASQAEEAGQTQVAAIHVLHEPVLDHKAPCIVEVSKRNREDGTQPLPFRTSSQLEDSKTVHRSLSARGIIADGTSSGKARLNFVPGCVRGPKTEYMVQVQTGGVKGASDVEAEFFVELIGTNASSGPLRLAASDNEFRFVKNQKDTFLFVLPHLGVIVRFRIFRNLQSRVLPCPGTMCRQQWLMTSASVFEKVRISANVLIHRSTEMFMGCCTFPLQNGKMHEDPLDTL